MIKFTVLTLFPSMINEFKNASIMKKAIDKQLAQIDIVDLREYGEGTRRNVDDTVYGGGTGMIITVPVLDRALESIFEDNRDKDNKLIYLTPKGKVFTQSKAKSMSEADDDVNYICICGHYEGIDDRIFKLYDIEEISVGDYVLTGGEIPAMILIDSVTRLVKGVLKDDATIDESHSEILLEHLQFTKPAEYKGIKVPDVLVSGNHGEIEKYRLESSINETYLKRPDLFEQYKKNNKNNVIKKGGK